MKLKESLKMSVATDFPVALMTCLICLGVYSQLLVPMHQDIGWLLWAASRTLDGAIPYRDIVEVNPPLIIYLMMPISFLIEYFGISPGITYKTCASILIGFVLIHCNRLLKKRYDCEKRALRFYLVSIMAFMLFWCNGADFGQRDHLIIALFMPYLILRYLQTIGRTDTVGSRILSALFCGLAICIKSTYFVLFLVIEGYVLFRQRSIRSVLCLETITVVLMGIGFLILVMSCAPYYLLFMVPYGIDTYWAYGFELSARNYAIYALWTAFLISCLIYLRRSPALADLALMVFWAVQGSYVSYLLMAHFKYQTIPYKGLSSFIVLVAVMVFIGRRFQWVPRREGRVSPVWLIVWMGVLSVGIYRGIPDSLKKPFNRAVLEGREPDVREQGFSGLADMQDVFNRYAEGHYVLLLTTNISGGFPAVNMSSAKWGSRFPALWILPAIIRVREDPESGGRLSDRRAAEIEAYLFDAVIDDMRKYDPAVILVDISQRKDYIWDPDFDYIEYFSRDKRFVDAWKDYGYLMDVQRRTDKRYAVYLRKR